MDKADSLRQVSKWATLNRGVLAVIFGKLDVRDLTMGASRVCLSWFLASHNKTLWSTVDLSKLHQVDEGLSLVNILNKISKFLGISEARRSLRNITKLSCSAPRNLFFDFDSYIQEEDLTFAAERMPNIEKLVLPRWCFQTKNSFQFAFNRWKNLKTRIIAHDCITWKFDFRAVGENCNNLTNLKHLGYLENYIAEQIVSYLKRLMRCSFISNKGVLLLITSLQKLEILNLSHCKELKWDSHPNNLETVTIHSLVQAATRKLDKFIICSRNNCSAAKICQIIVCSGPMALGIGEMMR